MIPNPFDQRSQQRSDPADVSSAKEMARTRRLSQSESRCEASSPRQAPYHNAFPCALRRRGVVAPFYGGVPTGHQIICDYLILSLFGIFSGLLAGILGIGSGVILVPFIKALGYSPVQAVATSSFAIVMTSISGS